MFGMFKLIDVLAAMRTGIGIGIGQLLQAVELLAAVFATENVDGHRGNDWQMTPQ